MCGFLCAAAENALKEISDSAEESTAFARLLAHWEGACLCEHQKQKNDEKRCEDKCDTSSARKKGNNCKNG